MSELLPRRDVLYGAAVMTGALLVLSACGEGSSPAPKPNTSPAATASPSPEGPTFPEIARVGLAMGSSLSGLTKGELTTQLDRVAGLGVRTIRQDADWSLFQPNGPKEFDWRDLDQIAEGVKAKGLGWVAILAYTPGWARPNGAPDTNKVGPRDSEAFANAAHEFVARYKGTGALAGIEIWNEQNTDWFWNQPNPERFAQLVASTSAAVRAIAPKLPIITGGVARGLTESGVINPAEFIDRMLDHVDPTAFDALGFHPYSFPAQPKEGEDWNGFTQLVGGGGLPSSSHLAGVLERRGLSNMPVVLSEFGAPTGGDGPLASLKDEAWDAISQKWEGSHADEAFQAELIRQFLGHEYPGLNVTSRMVYTLMDQAAQGESGDREAYFGILRVDGSRKPAADVVAAAAKK